MIPSPSALSALPNFAAAIQQDLRNGEVAGVAIAIVLVGVLWLLLPQRGKRLARQPVVMLVLHLVAHTLMRVVVTSEGTLRVGVSISAVVFLLASIGRSAVLLVLDVGLGRRLTKPLPKIIRDLVQGVVYVFVALASLRAAGIEPGSILTTSAVLTAVIGLSLQDTMGNLFAGLALQMQTPFVVGDWIQYDDVASHLGKVIEVNWRATKVVTLDDVEIVVPNGVLAKAPIINYSRPGGPVARSVVVSVLLSIPPKKVQRVLLDAMRDIDGVLSDPPPTVFTSNFNDCGTELKVRFWTDQFHRRFAIDGEVLDRIWYALERAGTPMAWPTREHYVHQVTEETEARAAKERASSHLEAMRSVDFLAALPEEEVTRLAGYARSHLYARGEGIVRRGDKTNELFVVRDGEVKVMVPAGRGGALTEVARLGPGKFFGEMALMTGEPRNADVVAATDTELIAIGFEAFHATLKAHPELADRVSRVLAERQAKLSEHVARNSEETKKQIEETQSQLLGKIRHFFSL